LGKVNKLDFNFIQEMLKILTSNITQQKTEYFSRAQ